MNVKRIFLVSSMVVGLLGFMAAGAQATLISGTIDFTGTATFDNAFPNATKVVGFANTFVGVGTQTGDYSGLDGKAVTFNQPFILSNASTYQWTITNGGVTYAFAGLTETSYSQTNSSLDVEGTGTATITGYGATVGTWEFTSQGGNTTLTFSANQAVPEPATLLLLGLGLLGLGFVGIKRKREA